MICDTNHCRSARQPLVQAGAAIKEPSLLRKLTAAGAHATLSPARRTRGKENVAGPSTRTHMERVGEEDEDVEELFEDVEPRGYEAGIRERELATQKARIVSQMTDRKARVAPEVEKRLSPRKPLAPPRTVPIGEARRAAPVYKSREVKVSLFELCGRNLEAALVAGPDYRSSCRLADLKITDS
jgi:phenylpyruvate tautomerase PptA (4-oxalocrotonate tautomerase family)